MIGAFIISMTVLIRLSSHHFIQPMPQSCELAKKCNHTWESVCGQNQLDYANRLFVDECDMHEFNCDTKNSFHKVKSKICSSKCTHKGNNVDNVTLTTNADINTENTTTSGEDKK